MGPANPAVRGSQQQKAACQVLGPTSFWPPFVEPGEKNHIHNKRRTPTWFSHVPYPSPLQGALRKPVAHLPALSGPSGDAAPHSTPQMSRSPRESSSGRQLCLQRPQSQATSRLPEQVRGWQVRLEVPWASGTVHRAEAEGGPRGGDRAVPILPRPCVPCLVTYPTA